MRTFSKQLTSEEFDKLSPGYNRVLVEFVEDAEHISDIIKLSPNLKQRNITYRGKLIKFSMFDKCRVAIAKNPYVFKEFDMKSYLGIDIGGYVIYSTDSIELELVVGDKKYHMIRVEDIMGVE